MTNETPHETTPTSVWLYDCHCDNCSNMRSAVQRLIDSFGQVPSRWIQQLLEHQGECSAVPMWGTCFLISDSVDIRGIEALMGNIPEDDEDGFWGTGWQLVAQTGIYARWVDDELVLAIDGAGYSFYFHHWQPL